MSMIHYISLHVESARAALKELLRQPIGTLLTLLMLAVAMTLPLFMYLGIQSGQSVLGKLNESPQITVYMDTDAADSDADTVKKQFRLRFFLPDRELIGIAKPLPPGIIVRPLFTLRGQHLVIIMPVR